MVMAEGGRAQSSAILLFSESVEVMGELLSIGREIASQGALPLAAAAMGVETEVLTAQALACGVDQVLAVHASRAEAMSDDEGLAAGLCAAIRHLSPQVVLVGATRTGAAVAARAAQLLGVPYASNCVAVELDQNGHLRVERRMYGGRFVARQLLIAPPRLVTVPPKRFAAAPKVPEAQGTVHQVAFDPPTPRLKRLDSNERARSADDITKAELIVAAGRGVRKMEDLRLLDDLAKMLGGVLAGSRPLTGDVDWLPIDKRIGLSGQTVRPNLYIACGISGQIEHLVGMKGARTVVAINNDPKAPIHGEADYSVIGDLYEIVPALQRACEKARSKAA